jgi:hypothetical protein
MAGKFKFDAQKFREILKDYSGILEKSIPDCVALNARLLCVELARRTQPFGNSEAVKQKGEKAIIRDLLGKGGSGTTRAGLFMGSNASEDEGFRYYAEGPNVRLFISKDGHAYGTDKTFFRPNASQDEMRAFHKGKFVNGKMSSAGSRTRDVGRWKFIEKMIVGKDALKTYVDKQILKVGWVKSAWAACANELPSVISGQATRGIPAWVTRHDSPNSDVKNRLNDKENPRVVLKNRTGYASQVCPPSEQLKASQVVVAKMKKQMERILKKRNKTLTE